MRASFARRNGCPSAKLNIGSEFEAILNRFKSLEWSDHNKATVLVITTGPARRKPLTAVPSIVASKRNQHVSGRLPSVSGSNRRA